MIKDYQNNQNYAFETNKEKEKSVRSLFQQQSVTQQGVMIYTSHTPATQVHPTDICCGHPFTVS